MHQFGPPTSANPTVLGRDDATGSAGTAANIRARATLERYLAEHLPDLRRFVRSRFQHAPLDHESAEDLVQWVCLAAIKHLDDFRGTGRATFRRWLFAIAQNVIGNRIHYWRRSKRNPCREACRPEDGGLQPPADDVRDPGDAWADRERHARVARALDRLPPVYAKVVYLARLREMPYTEIAAAVGRSPTAVRVILCRALRQLRDLLTEPDRG